jgi:hypothetical protein
MPGSTARAIVAREAGRAVRRTRDVKLALENETLEKYLEIVDAKWPGLLDTERLRMIYIIKDHYDGID